MSLTKRVSIQWGESSPTEDTETLVLTSPGQHFVDIRSMLEDSSKAAWAFCGKKISKFDGSTQYTHEIDSLGQTVEDEGHFQTLDSGDLKETGHMLNPESGKDEDYTEIWRPMNSESVPLQALGGGTNSPFLACQVMLRIEGDRVTGKAVRLGQWIQGVQLTKEGNIDFFRAYFDSANLQTAKITATNGGLFSASLLFNESRSKGTLLDDGWKVVESNA